MLLFDQVENRRKLSGVANPLEDQSATARSPRQFAELLDSRHSTCLDPAYI